MFLRVNPEVMVPLPDTLNEFGRQGNGYTLHVIVG